VSNSETGGTQQGAPLTHGWYIHSRVHLSYTGWYILSRVHLSYTGWYIRVTSHNPGGIYGVTSHNPGMWQVYLPTRVCDRCTSLLPGYPGVYMPLYYPGIMMGICLSSLCTRYHGGYPPPMYHTLYHPGYTILLLYIPASSAVLTVSPAAKRRSPGLRRGETYG